MNQNITKSMKTKIQNKSSKSNKSSKVEDQKLSKMD